MTVAAHAVVRGAAVVIDDRINESEDAIQLIIDQLTSAEVPTIRLSELPSVDSLVHWKQFGLIVLDWELSYSNADEDTEVPVGVAVPSELASETREQNFKFIRSLLDETALPIFVASNADIDGIRSELADAFSDHGSGLAERVKVFSKSELEVSLFDAIGAWIESRPALKALRAWKRAYVEAEIQTFHQFSRAEEDWVVSVQRAAIADGASFEATLRDLLASNIINRIGPLAIEMPEPPTEFLSDATALRRVLHLSAVIPGDALVANEPSTGDLFVLDSAEEPYEEIRILLTPECDLTARDPKWRFTYLPAVRAVPTGTKTSAQRVKSVSSPSKQLHLKSNLLTPGGDEYEIALQGWESIWVERGSSGGVEHEEALDPGEIWPGYRRIGRLLDPYVTHIQQNFSMVTIRKGLPNLPKDFYEGWAELATET